MLSMELDVVQYDCPYIHASERQDVEFFLNQWDFDPAAEALETRILLSVGEAEALDLVLTELGEHDIMREFELLRRKSRKALLGSTIGETQAMESIRKNDGYITGPFDIRDGNESWRVGFDTQAPADGALADLHLQNDDTVESRDVIDLEDFHALVEHIDAAGNSSTAVPRCRTSSGRRYRPPSRRATSSARVTPRSARWRSPSPSPRRPSRRTSGGPSGRSSGRSWTYSTRSRRPTVPNRRGDQSASSATETERYSSMRSSRPRRSSTEPSQAFEPFSMM